MGVGGVLVGWVRVLVGGWGFREVDWYKMKFAKKIPQKILSIFAANHIFQKKKSRKQLLMIKKIEIVNDCLAKQENRGPRVYKSEQLKKEKTTGRYAIHNNLALTHMREIKPSDLVLF